MANSARKILVVDDDPWIAKMLEFVATDSGHVAIVCRDGNDAIEKFAEFMPDLVLLDVVLPRLDGLKVCEHIKKTPLGRLTPVLVFSGIYRDSTEALKFGADAFLAKPFTPQQIGAQIKQMLPIVPDAPPADLAAPPLRPGPSETLLSQEPLPRALGRLHKAQLTGVMTLRSRVGIKYLFVEKGNVVQVRSQVTASGVTTSLLARGRVTPQQLEELERRSRESAGKKVLSQLLVESNLVRADELRKLVLVQMLWEIFEVFRWREGCHAFSESPPLPASAGLFKLDVQTPNLIHWGVRKMDPRLEDLDALVPSRLSYLARMPDSEELLRPLLLTERERGILGLIDGTKTVQEIASVAELAGSDASPALYTMLSLGAIVPSTPLSHGAPRYDLPEPSPLTSTARSLQGPFALALMELWRNKETGVLKCVGPLDNRSIYVSHGVSIFARSERNADRLDQLLVRQAVITPEQAQKSLELQGRTPNKRVGQILMEMGAITLEQLHATVKMQVQNLVLSLFTWAEGKYLFEPGPLPSQEAITLDWDTPGAVLQGLRGLPLNYIRPLAPPRDAIVERSQDLSILGELQLNSAEQKLLALLVGRHPMEQLLALDFIANESLLRGLVTFAALGLITVHAGRKAPPQAQADDDEGVVIDPLESAPRDHAPREPARRPVEAPARPPAYVKREPIAPPRPAPENAWRDPVPSLETEPGEAWTAPQPRRAHFLAGPAMAAFEAQHASAPPPAEPDAAALASFAAETEAAAAEADAAEYAAQAHAAGYAEPHAEYAGPHAGYAAEAHAEYGAQAPAAETQAEPQAVEPEPLDDTFTFAPAEEHAAAPRESRAPPEHVAQAGSAQPSREAAPQPGARDTARLPQSFGAEQANYAPQQGAGDGGVPRALYDALLAEKQQLQQKLLSVLQERRDEATVPRELFDQMQAEKRQLQEKMMLMLDELLRLRQQPAGEEKDPRGNVRPFPGSRKNE